MPRRRRLGPSVVVVIVLSSACSWGGSEDVAAPARSLGPADPLRDRARTEGTVGVIVELAVPQQADGSWERREIAAAQRKLLAELGKGVEVVARDRTTPQIALELTPQALKRLRASPLVLGIHLNEADAPTE